MTVSAFPGATASLVDGASIETPPSSASLPAAPASQPPRALTQAPLPEDAVAEEEVAYAVASRLAAQLHASVEAFAGKELATYSWTAGHNSGGSWTVRPMPRFTPPSLCSADARYGR